MDRPDSPIPAGWQALRTELLAAGVPYTPDDSPEVMLETLKAEIITFVTADPAMFDRARYDWLLALWRTVATGVEGS